MSNESWENFTCVKCQVLYNVLAYGLHVIIVIRVDTVIRVDINIEYQ